MIEQVPDNTAAVRCVDLGKVYGSQPVLSDINLEIRRGERCCFVGTNGCGKTTLLEIIMGLKVASNGNVEVLGRNPLDHKLKQQRVMLMDRPSYPYYAKVKEMVWLYAGFYPGRIDISAQLNIFELDGNSYIRHLSKGQRQRLALLLTLLGDPILILLDEPTSGLDPRARYKLWQILYDKLKGKPESTLLFATHDLSEAEHWADRIAILHRGSLVAICSPEELCRSVIGRSRKVTIIGQSSIDVTKWQNEDIASVAYLGAETALYTDHPDRVLQRIGLAGDSLQIRIENVSLRDAFFKLTGEVLNEKPTFAM